MKFSNTLTVSWKKGAAAVQITIQQFTKLNKKDSNPSRDLGILSTYDLFLKISKVYFLGKLLILKLQILRIFRVKKSDLGIAFYLICTINFYFTNE